MQPKETTMTFKRAFRSRFAPLVLLPAFAVAFLAGTGMAQTAEELRLTVGKSVVIDYPTDIGQISTSSPDVVDASPVTTRQILMNAKGVGVSTVVIWSKTNQQTFYNVTVEMNLDPLRRLLQDSFPNEKIDVRSARDSISLNGTVSSKEVADRAAALASGFGKTVVNNLQLPAPGIDKQILLRVKFAELDRQVAAQYGVNIISTGATNTIGRTTTQQFSPASPQTIGGGQNTFSITDALNIFAFRPDLNLAAFIKALQQENVLQILAEPNLVTSNGKEATFLVGGEFPVPVLQGAANAGAVTIMFREFGIRLLFTPQLTANNTIKLALRQEVSSLDISNGVTLSGFFVPGLSTRRAETNVELANGQSFVVAGLIDQRESEQFSKIPIIGEIPILGALFKSKSETKNNTELIMLITPEITTPLGPNDPKPALTFPKEFLKRLNQGDLQPAGAKPNAKNEKKKAKETPKETAKR
jgi:pilus assembly protein CpaC